MTTSSRSTRATTKFKYSSRREVGEPKTLVTMRLENSILDALAKEGNREGLSMSAVIRRVLRRGLDLPDGKKPTNAKKPSTARKRAR